MSDAPIPPAALVGGLLALERRLKDAGDPIDCEIRISKGDWGGQHVLLTLSPWSATYIARQLVSLVERNFHGAHFDIDKASIAVETQDQICFALKVTQE